LDICSASVTKIVGNRSSDGMKDASRSSHGAGERGDGELWLSRIRGLSREKSIGKVA